MVSPLQRNAPEIIGLMGVGLLIFQHSKYIPIMKTNKWVQNIALRINTRFPFAPATLLSSGISLGVGKYICKFNELREQLTRAQADKAESARQVEDLRGQLTSAQAHSTQIREQLTRAQTANNWRNFAKNARKVEFLREGIRAMFWLENRQLEEARSDIARLRRQLKGDLITRLPWLALSKSCSYLGRSDIPYVARSCRKFNESIKTQEVQNSLIEEFAFGPKDWKRFFGDVGEVPPIPEVMPEILKSQCPFNPGKQVRDTHMLVLIPQKVNSRHFTLNLLEELIKKPQEKNGTSLRFYPTFLKEALGDTQTEKSYWILMTKDVIRGSRNKTCDEHKQLVQEKEADGYELPRVIEAATSILMHYFKTDERLYAERRCSVSPMTYTYTRCQETVTIETQRQRHVFIGGFSRGGLLAYDGGGGLGGVRKFQDIGTW